MSQPSPSATPEELILAMLRDVLARQAQHMGLEAQPLPAPQLAPSSPTPQPLPPAALPAPLPLPAQPEPAAIEAPLPASLPVPEAALDGEAPAEPLSRAELEALAEFEARAAERPAPSSLPAILRALIAGLFVCLLLINLPVFRGVALARALPDRQALIIRDGLLIKGSGPEIYVLEDNHKRWISSLDAFAHYGYVWEAVHVVEDSFVAQFPEGRPLHVLLKCDSSPHIYRLENDVKRWIKDIPTFLAEGHVWEDVRQVSCAQLRAIPDGPPIPTDAGPPPQP